ncbi:MAG: S-formylglutathione hydrolase [Lentisphaeraceae bacterium]|nr:S-formylglutathione hydrolase [Lentisphaeraceae bacterium]
MELVSQNKCFNGTVKFYKHSSSTVKTDMTFSIFLPPKAETEKVPLIYWLSGLTCTAENFMFKAGAQRNAAELGIAIVCPDTSPRGAQIDGDKERYDLGEGAGFYINATTDKWSDYYNMYSYVTEELPSLINQNFNVDAQRKSIFGHSMGGHGALICAFKNPQEYKSVSAFSPICAPSECQWGQLAFGEFLGEDKNAWAQYDANLLAASTEWNKPVLLEQGSDDQFMEQLNPQLFAKSCADNNIPVTLNMRPGYDHSYYFIASFVDAHLEYHAKALKA